MLRLKNAVITSIALCKRGKNKMRTLYKSADGDRALEVRPLIKADIERGELLSVVYAPNREDDDGEGMEPEEIRKAAHRAMQNGLDLDIEHDGRKLSREEAWVAESFIVSKGDERFQDWRDYENNPVGDLTGAWASVIRLESEPLRKAYREGRFDGVSMFGEAVAVQSKSQTAEVVRHVERAANQEISMTIEELKAVLKAANEEVLAKVDEKIQPILKAMAPKEGDEQKPVENPRPVFKGSTADAEALAAYQADLAAWELNQKISKGEITSEQLAELVKSAAEGEPTDEEAGVAKTDTAEVKSLKRRLFKAQKRSNVSKSAEDNADASDDAATDVKKALDMGSKIAGVMATRQGMADAGMKIVSKQG